MGYKDKEKAAEYARAWRAKNVETVRADDRERAAKKRLEDPTYASQKVREWRAANPDKARAEIARTMRRQKERYLTDPEFREQRRKIQERHLAKPGVRELRQEKGRVKAAVKYEQFPEKQRASKLKSSYGITLERYDEMVAAQGGKCAICGTDKPNGRGHRWNIDHCHDRNKVRALLCHSCNTGLGAFKDKPELLRAAADYLEHHGDGHQP